MQWRKKEPNTNTNTNYIVFNISGSSLKLL